MGHLLRSLRDDQLYLHLGFARLGDYAAERLGISLRTAQELIRVERALARLPQTSRSYLAGEITATHVRLLSRLATVEDEGLWLAQARRMDVRAFGRSVAAVLERDERGPGTVDRTAPDAEDEAEWVPLSLRGPAWMLRWWRDTVTFVRRLAGSALPPGAALEVVLAESADITRDPRYRSLPVVRGNAGSGPSAPDGEPLARGPGSPATGDPTSSGSPCGDHAGAADRDGRPGGATGKSKPPGREDSAIAARRVDARLRELVGARQRGEAELADHLVCVRASRGYELKGFSSLKAYALLRLGLSPRQMNYLLSLHRTLERLPDLRRAFVMGRLTLRQTLLVGRVATKSTTSPWVRRAERITLRRLEDEVEYWELLREERPEVWEMLRGGPLPEGLVLVPGQGVRVQEPASGSGPVGDQIFSSAVEAVGGHISAPASASRNGVAAGLVAEAAGVHGSARGPAIDAWTFVGALEASETVTPLPARRCTLRMRVEPGVGRQWNETIALLRATSEDPLEEWEAFALVLRRFWKVWDNRETRAQRRRHPTVDRDGGRCTAPGCRAVGSGRLHEHHIVFRSHGGLVKDGANITTLCTTHHGHLLHAGVIQCRGDAPDHLSWEFGLSRNLPPFLAFYGERHTGGSAM